ncbi:MAG TPA: hypothetical protein DD412_08075 [Holosporales bacterium]|nr:hypothetical protein [Holosporales bacterium]
MLNHFKKAGKYLTKRVVPLALGMTFIMGATGASANASLDKVISNFKFSPYKKSLIEKNVSKITDEDKVFFIDASTLRAARKSLDGLSPNSPERREKASKLLNQIVRKATEKKPSEADLFLSDKTMSWPAGVFDSVLEMTKTNRQTGKRYTQPYAYLREMEKEKDGKISTIKAGLVIIDSQLPDAKARDTNSFNPYTPDVMAAFNNFDLYNTIGTLAHENGHVPQGMPSTIITEETLKKNDIDVKYDETGKFLKTLPYVATAIRKGKLRGVEVGSDLEMAKAIKASSEEINDKKGGADYLKSKVYFRVMEALEFNSIDHSTFAELSEYIQKNIDPNFSTLKIRNDVHLYEAINEAHIGLKKCGMKNYKEAQKNVRDMLAYEILDMAQNGRQFFEKLRCEGYKNMDKQEKAKASATRPEGPQKAKKSSNLKL